MQGTQNDQQSSEYEEELLYCPDCEANLRLKDGIESTGEGVAFGYVECADCDFEAREEWVHDRTVEVDDD